MPGPRYCRLCGDELRGGRVDRIYCDVNCRTRASRMRKRGVPVGPVASPQPVSLAALLTEGMTCPCCGVRIALQASAMQAGMPTGYAVPAAPDREPAAITRTQHAKPRAVVPDTTATPRRTERPHASQSATSAPAPVRRDRTHAAQDAPRAQRSPASPSSIPRTPAEQSRDAPRNSPQGRRPIRGRKDEPTQQRTVMPPPPAYRFNYVAPAPSTLNGSFDPSDLIAASKPEEWRGRPSPALEEQRKQLVECVLRDLTAALVRTQTTEHRPYIRGWITSQEKFLEYFGLRMTEAIQVLWAPATVRTNPFALADKALQEVRRRFVITHGSQIQGAEEWWGRHSGLLELISQILVTKLSFANPALGTAEPNNKTGRPAGTGRP